MTKQKRITVVCNPEIERDLDQMKRERFYNKSQSEMLRQLITDGIKVAKGYSLGGQK